MTHPSDSHSASSHGQTFVWVFVALCGLTAISVAIAYIPIFPNQTATWLAFLAVAVAKASLVICYFMHLRWEKVWKYFMTIPATILGLALLASLMPDIGMRSLYYSEQRMESGPDTSKQLPEKNPHE